jgi:hypothetical protein
VSDLKSKVFLSICYIATLSITLAQAPKWPYLSGTTKSIVNTSFCKKYICQGFKAPNQDPYQEHYRLKKMPGVVIGLYRSDGVDTGDLPVNFLDAAAIYPVDELSEDEMDSKPQLVTSLILRRAEVIRDFERVLTITKSSDGFDSALSNPWIKGCIQDIQKARLSGNYEVGMAEFYTNTKPMLIYQKFCEFDFGYAAWTRGMTYAFEWRFLRRAP